MGIRAKYHQLPADAWTRLAVQGIWTSLTGPRRRLSDPQGLTDGLMFAWALGGPAFLLGGITGISLHPGSPSGWFALLGGLAWLATWILYLRRPATIEPELDRWGRRIKK